MLDAILSFKTLWYVLVIIYVPACISLIIIVLLQKGKGTGFAGAFGAGAGAPGSDAVFGPKAGKSLPVRLTYIGATIFMVIAVIMSMISGKVNIGDAPELEDVTGTGAVISSTTGGSSLDAYGLGTGVIGQAQPVDASTESHEGHDHATTPDAAASDGETPEVAGEESPEATPEQ